jgi:threonine aldolase
VPEGTVTTNMVYFNLNHEIPITPQELAKRMDSTYQIKIEPESHRQFRLVTHRWVSSEDIETAVGAFREILSN